MVHTRTAIDEQFGKSLSRTITANADLPLNYGPGGARLIAISASAGLSVRLPKATFLRTGPAVYSVYNSGANSFTVTDWGGTTVQIVLAGRIADLHLLSNATTNGTWLSEASVATAGTPLTIGRVPLEIGVKASQNNVNLRTLADLYGYTGSYPLALKVEIASGINIGSDGVGNDYALQTGSFFAGTTIMLVNRGTIQGRGGLGGLGGEIGGAGGIGLPGGTAVYAQNSVVVVNLGTIAGGGGGGGGGGSIVNSLGGGGGGGGGQGYLQGFGGPGYFGGADGGQGIGTLGFGGSGGSAGGGRGGDGGIWGSAGSAGQAASGGGAGGAAGAAGYSLRSAGGGPVITKLTAGLLYGLEALT